MGFITIPHITIYDEYIERQKLTQQKNPFEYLIPPTLNCGEAKN